MSIIQWRIANTDKVVIDLKGRQLLDTINKSQHCNLHHDHEVEQNKIRELR